MPVRHSSSIKTFQHNLACSGSGFNPSMRIEQVSCVDLGYNFRHSRSDSPCINLGSGPVPFFAPPITQEASWKLEETRAFGQPEVLEQRAFQVATLGSPGTGVVDTGDNSGTDGSGSGGSESDGSESDGSSGEIITGGSGGGAFGLSMLLLFVNRRRRY